SAGSLSRSTNGPSLAGLPRRTAACAPAGRDGGAAPHWTVSAATTVWCGSWAAARVEGTAIVAAASATATRRQATAGRRIANSQGIISSVLSGSRESARGFSAPGDDDFEVLARHDHRAAAVA